MENIYNINGEVFRFELYNLNYFQDCDVEISGHYTFWWHKPTNRYVFCKHGGYHNLVSFRPIKEDPRFPTDREKSFLEELVCDQLRHAYFYSHDASCNRGAYLLDELERDADKRPDGTSREHFKHDYDEYYTNVMKYNGVFDEEYPGPDYKCDEEEWADTKRKDQLACDLFESPYKLVFVPGTSWISEKFVVEKVHQYAQK